MTHSVLYSYDLVNQPLARVRDAVLANPAYVFRHATAANKAHDAKLHVDIGGLDIGTEGTMAVTAIEHETGVTSMQLEWRAATYGYLFPTMHATLSLIEIAPMDTKLELRGTYEAPLGKVGQAIDEAAGHRLAEAVATRFVRDVADWLREQLATSPS